MTQTIQTGRYFTFFNEIGIIEQLSRAFLEAQLPDGIIAPHFSVLNHLIRVRDGQTPLVLARAFQVPKTTMTHTLGGLQKHGLVDIRPNPKDARSKCVWITDAGRTLREETITALAPDLRAVAEVVSPADLDRVLPILEKLRQYLDQARDE
ncbi:MarR family winged helix-turn-helix transcriptional regulator [Yoonia sp. SDW83-1]|uniref:MarR family winged helix-turn-helix transcriptional regulator n=1 Tax=Yoonia sp. SDW83-1 TaxID=3366945 RepID=UPI00398C6AC4